MIRAYAPGTEVGIGPTGSIVAVVHEIVLRAGCVWYELVWWRGDDRITCVVPDFEVGGPDEKPIVIHGLERR